MSCGCSRLEGASAARQSYTNCDWSLEDLYAIKENYESIENKTKQERRMLIRVNTQISQFDKYPCKYYKKIMEGINGMVFS